MRWLTGFLCSLLILAPVALASTTVNDVTRANPIEVDEVVSPTTVPELVDIVKNHHGKISIAGGRYSQGGQTALEHSLNIDMKQLDRVIAFDKQKKEITVQAGITWKKIQRYVDPYDLSVKIMQTYSNFTVGGSLSVNVHGRYVGLGPVIGSVKSFRIVTADGKLLNASPTENSQFFYGAIGGYGSLGVIATVTLSLADNINVERVDVKMPVTDYKKFFFEKVRNNPDAIFHNGDIYPPGFTKVRAVTWVKTNKPVTETSRFIEQTENTWKRKFFISLISHWPLGKQFREYVLDPIAYRTPAVYRRNFEASYDVSELEPYTRLNRTYVLQEYFVPVERFDDFVPKMREIFQKNHVNVFNVSIRHANQDPGAVMAWARHETFAFVVYYEQGLDEASRRHVGVWTREMTDAVLSCDGAYYLPYQIHATDSQFFKAYPRAVDFFRLKERLDPAYKFENKFLQRYLSEEDFKAHQISAPPYVKGFVDYKLRPEEQTYLTVPEWYIVFSSDEFAKFLVKHSPSDFPWFSSIGQFWKIDSRINKETKGIYPGNLGYRVMIGVIGASFTGEYLIKGIYEKTVGRLTTWLATDAAGNFNSSADQFMQRLQSDYVAFIRLRPWYEFTFLKYFKPLWREPSRPGESGLRRFERRLFYSFEILAKSGYGWVIRKATQAAYDAEDLEVQVLVQGDAKAFLRIDPQLKIRKQFLGNYFIASMPRYEPFTDLLPKLAGSHFTFYEIAGNQRMVATFITPRGSDILKPFAESVFRWPILTEPDRERQMIAFNTKNLVKLLDAVNDSSSNLDHAFDY